MPNPIPFLLTLLLTAAAPAASMPGSPGPRLVLRIYNLAGVDPDVVEAAETAASRVLERAGIPLLWVSGSADEEEAHTQIYATGASCGDPLQSGELRLRLVYSAPPGLKPAALGFALPCSGRGVQATLFVERIEQTAHAIPASCAMILGHAMAHEIGHVLLRSNLHSQAGLMRAHWGGKEWVAMAQKSLSFTPRESAAIRRLFLSVSASPR